MYLSHIISYIIFKIKYYIKIKYIIFKIKQNRKDKKKQFK